MHQTLETKLPLPAVPTQAILNHPLHRRMNSRRTAQLPNSLGRLAHGEVASAAFAVLSFPSCCQSEPLFRGFMCFLFRHNQTKIDFLLTICNQPTNAAAAPERSNEPIFQILGTQQYTDAPWLFQVLFRHMGQLK